MDGDERIPAVINGMKKRRSATLRIPSQHGFVRQMNAGKVLLPRSDCHSRNAGLKQRHAIDNSGNTVGIAEARESKTVRAVANHMIPGQRADVTEFASQLAAATLK